MKIIFDLPEGMPEKLKDIDHVFRISDFSDSLISTVLVEYQEEQKKLKEYGSPFDEMKYNSWSSHTYRTTGMKTLKHIKVSGEKMPLTIEVSIYEFPWSEEKVAIVTPISMVVHWKFVDKYIRKTFKKAKENRNIHNSCAQFDFLHWMRKQLR